MLPTPALDYETRNIYILEIQATDTPGLTSSANLTIYVTDANDKPVITSLPLIVFLDEDSNTGKIIHNVSVHDDEGDVIRFDIVMSPSKGPFLVTNKGK